MRLASLAAVLTMLLGAPSGAVTDARAPLPAPPKPVNLAIPMRDGVRLNGDVFLPARPGRYPVILEISPYRPKGEDYSGEAGYWNQAGYAFAIVDIRGQNGSGGRFEFMSRAEGRDGYDAIEWLARQPWANGRVGMRGSSYSGTNQLRIAALAPPSLKCITPSDSASSDFEGVASHGGAFALRWALTWPRNLSDEGMSGNGAIDWSKLLGIPLRELDQRAYGRPLRLYREFLATYAAGRLGKPILTEADAARVTVPSLAFTGWWDGTLAGTTVNFDKLRRNSADRTDVHLIIGPWEHFDATDGGYDYRTGNPVLKVGEIHVPRAGIIDGLALTRGWYDWCLKGGAKPTLPVAHVWLSGSNRWLDLDNYPPHADIKALYLDGNGKLSWAPARNRAPDRYRYDPVNPVPTVFTGREGEQVDPTSNPADLSPLLKGRKDILVFETTPLRSAVTILGRVKLILHASSDQRDTDFVAMLHDVGPDGRSVSLGPQYGATIRARFRDGLNRETLLTPGKPVELQLNLMDMGHTFLAGHRLRLTITSSSYPWISVNPNTGKSITDDAPSRIAVQTIYHDQVRPSRLLLPVLPTSLIKQIIARSLTMPASRPLKYRERANKQQD